MISFAYMLGSGNSLVWSWFFWVYVHPIASVIWFAICFFALVISMEVRQLEKNEDVNLTFSKNTKLLQYSSVSMDDADIIDIVIIPPKQLPKPKMTSTQNRKSPVTIAQLPNSIKNV